MGCVMSTNTKKLIEKIVKETVGLTVDETITELQRRNNIKLNNDYFQKTEVLLYNYKNFKESSAEKEQAIKDLEENGLKKTGKSIVFMQSGNGKNVVDAILEKKEEYRRAKETTDRLIKKIENALEKIRDDKYFFIIQKKYFENETIEKIVEWLENEESQHHVGTSERTIMRNKKRLINKLLIPLFGDKAISDICNDII